MCIEQIMSITLESCSIVINGAHPELMLKMNRLIRL